jgi:anti-anti-sigma factor
MNTNPSADLSAGTILCQAPNDITSTSETAFRDQLEHLMTHAPSGWKYLQINLQATRMIDSKGLNLIVSIVKRLRTEGRGVQLIAPQPSVRRILAFTRLDRHATVINTDGAPV